MKNKFIIPLIFCYIIILVFCRPIQAQSISDSVDMSWMYKIYSTEGNFIDISKQAEQFFQQHPDYDSISELKHLYLDWKNYWQSRSQWVDSASEPGDMKSALKAMDNLAKTPKMTSASPYLSQWKLASPISSLTQNLGIITCTWTDPDDAKHILAGTEASGLWETKNADLANPTWKNLTDNFSITYPPAINTIPIGFGVSSIVVKKGMGINTNSDVIAITTFLSGTDLALGHGLGILISRSSGAVWQRRSLINSSGVNISEMCWKIINAESNLINDVYVSCQDDKVYKTDIVSTASSILQVFDLNTANGGICTDPNATYIKRRIRDMELVGKNSCKTLFLTTDGFISNQTKCNAKIYFANLNGSTYTWQEIIPTTDPMSFIDYIAVEGIEEDLVRKCYFAYDIIQLNNNNTVSDNETFYIDTYTASDITVNNDCVATWNKSSTFNRSHTNNYSVGNDFAGFGYQYNAFAILGTEAYIGGYELHKINLSNSNVVRISAQGHYAHNNDYHYGIRSLELYSTNGANDTKLYMGTEGGISVYDISNNSISNKNGTGLAISEVSDISTSKNSKYDVIIHNSHRNGIWRFLCGYWDNFWWNDVGKILLDEKDRDHNDYEQPDYVHIVSSSTPWCNSCTFTRSPNCLGNGGGVYPITDTPIDNPEYNFNAPLVFSDNNNDTIYQGRHSIYVSVDFGSTWDTFTTNGVNGYPFTNNWSGNLKVIKIAPGNPDIMYIAFQGPTWGKDINGKNISSTMPENKIYKGIKSGSAGLWNWTDLTAGINNVTTNDIGRILKETGISDIIINPGNPNELWVTFDQFWGVSADSGAYRVLHLKNGNWSDYTLGLTSAPVNCIVYNEANPSIDELFVGTDVGVFYRNKSLPKWELFHNNNPQWIVSDLEINYNRMLLRAATWGRSVWETPIKCSLDTPHDYTINATPPPWDLPVTNCGDIIVNAGATLTINNLVEMAENKSITVRKGGKIILNNATIKSFCKTMWKGIKLEGDNSSSQLNYLQGSIELYNSNIEDAIIGILCVDQSNNNKGGGIVKAISSTFRNNRIAVKMLPYEYKDNNSTFIGNASIFSLCHFITDAPLNTYPLKPITFMSLSNIYGLSILGCNFENTNQDCNGYTYEGIGIDAKESYIYVNEFCSAINLPNTFLTSCPSSSSTPSVFSHLAYGISANGYLEKFSIQHTTFNENLRGLYMFSISNFFVLYNTFYLPNHYASLPTPPVFYGSEEQYGAYLNSCTENYHFENNLFSYDPFGIGGIGFIGLYIYDSGKPLKLIYNNTFNWLQYGLVALGNNGPEISFGNDGGLKIKCNDFKDCFNNIITVNNPFPTIGNENQGIAYFQGNPIPINTTQPAGNTFQTTAYSNGNPTYFYNETSQINYSCHVDLFTVPKENPLLVLGFTTTFISGLLFNKPISCPQSIYNIPIIIPNLGTQLGNLTNCQQQLNSANLIRTIWTDGGNTEALKQAVDLALPYEAYELYNDLISKSPYLSDEVLVKAILNENVLPPLMLKFILRANPQAVKSQDVMHALKNRFNPLPEIWIDELKDSSNFISPMEQLMGEVDYCSMQRQLAFNDLKSSYLYQNDKYYNDSLCLLLQKENRFDTDVELLYYYINHKKFQASEELIAQINSKYEFNEDLANEWQQTVQICSILTTLKSNNKELIEIDSAALSILHTIEKVNNSGATAVARKLLLQADSKYIYHEPIVLPEIVVPIKSSKPYKPKLQSQNSLAIYPNPAHDFATLAYEITEEPDALRFAISDVLGKVVYSKELSKQKDLLLIVLKGFAKGNYIATLFYNCLVLI